MSENNGNNGNGHRPRGSRKGKANIPLERKAEMIAAMPEYGNCQASVAQAFGVSGWTVSMAKRDAEVQRLLNVKKREIAEGFANLTQKLLKRYDTLADQAGLNDKGVTLLGICADKALLYAGEPTQITETRSEADRAEALRLLADLVAACEGDEAKARAILLEDAPTLSSWIN